MSTSTGIQSTTHNAGRQCKYSMCDGGESRTVQEFLDESAAEHDSWMLVSTCAIFLEYLRDRLEGGDVAVPNFSSGWYTCMYGHINHDSEYPEDGTFDENRLHNVKVMFQMVDYYNKRAAVHDKGDGESEYIVVSRSSTSAAGDIKFMLELTDTRCVGPEIIPEILTVSKTWPGA